MKERIFSDHWKIWIWSNVDRGCDKDGIFKILSENGFGYNDIVEELGHEPAEELSSIPNPLQHVVEVSGPQFFPNAKRFASDKIDVYTVENFLTPEECRGLIDLIKQDARPSTVVDGDAENPDPYFRTSRTCFLSPSKSTLVSEVDIRICRMLGINPAFSEEIQGQIYGPGEEFKPHTDWFNAKSAELNYAQQTENQRTWTFIVYLNDVESGGETAFENIDLEVKPELGKALFWNNLYTSGDPNVDALHCGRKLGQAHRSPHIHDRTKNCRAHF